MLDRSLDSSSGATRSIFDELAVLAGAFSSPLDLSPEVPSPQTMVQDNVYHSTAVHGELNDGPISLYVAPPLWLLINLPLLKIILVSQFCYWFQYRTNY